MSESDAAAEDDFARLAIDTLEEARSIVRFWIDRESHPDWSRLSATLPKSLMSPRETWREAEVAMSQASWELEQSRLGIWYNDMIESGRADPRSAIETLRTRLAKAVDHHAAALAAMERAEPARREAENRVAERWLRDHRTRFRELHLRFARVFDRLELVLAGLGRDATGVNFGAWKGASACQVLRDVGNKIIELLDEPREVFDDRGLDWDELGMAVRYELGRLLHRVADDQQRGGVARRTPLDVVKDPDCVAIRAVLAGGPKRLTALFADGRIKCSPTTTKLRLRMMKEAGLVQQTTNRGPWCLTEKGEHQRAEDAKSAAQRSR